MLAQMFFLLLPISLALASPVSNLAERYPSTQYTTSQSFTIYSRDPPFVTLDNGVDFKIQTDGNFVVYDNGVAAWNSKTGKYSCGSQNCFLNWQTDGNLVVYVNGGKAVWDSKTAGKGKTLYFSDVQPYLLIRDSGGNAVWSTPRPATGGDREPTGGSGSGPVNLCEQYPCYVV